MVRSRDFHAAKIAMARETGMDGIVSAFMERARWNKQRDMEKMPLVRAISLII